MEVTNVLCLPGSFLQGSSFWSPVLEPGSGLNKDGDFRDLAIVACASFCSDIRGMLYPESRFGLPRLLHHTRSCKPPRLSIHTETFHGMPLLSQRTPYHKLAGPHDYMSQLTLPCGVPTLAVGSRSEKKQTTMSFFVCRSRFVIDEADRLLSQTRGLQLKVSLAQNLRESFSCFVLVCT